MTQEEWDVLTREQQVDYIIDNKWFDIGIKNYEKKF
jgi:hypothetical protein